MQGNSLNAELLDAFPNLDERMTASAYEQAKGKLKPEVFEHILQEYNKTMRKPKLLDGKYRVFAIDGSDFTTPYNAKSDFVMNVPSGRPRKDGELVKPYCQVHANLLYDIENRIYQDCILQHKRQYKAVRSKNTKDQRWDFAQFCNVKCRVVKFRINNSDIGIPKRII